MKHAGLARRVRALVTGMVLALTGMVAAAQEAAFLLLMEDPSALATAALAASDRASRLSARRALCTAREREATALHALAHTRLGTPLPADVRGQLRVEVLPSLAAVLAFVPQAQATAAARAWHDTAVAKAPGVAALLRLGDPPSTDPAVSSPQAPRFPRAGNDSGPRAAPASCQGKPSGPGAVLAIFDNGAAADHPWLKRGLGRLHFQPGTPGGTDTPGLRHSHGTAMLGIYAQAALGLPLTTDDAEIAPVITTPFAIADTLIALAGPETGAGQVALARNLDWMLSAPRGRPFPDVLNYSQGNGPLCVPGEGIACADDGWAGITRLLDRAISDYAILVVKSAGNAGYDATRTTMTVPGDSFNALVVGNMHAFDWTRCQPGGPRTRHRAHRHSSVGPRPPAELIDVVAPGVRIDTAGVDPAWCLAVCENPAACDFCARLGRRAPEGDLIRKRNSGTSPAAAMAGVAALRVMQTGVDAPLAVKAVLINSADAWLSNGEPVPLTRAAACAAENPPVPHGPAPTGVHVDRLYGRGYLHPTRAVAEAKQVDTGTLAPGERRCLTAAGPGPWKFTLSWSIHDFAQPGPARLQLRELARDVRVMPTHPTQTTLQLAVTPADVGDRHAGRAMIAIERPGDEDAADPTHYALAASAALEKLECPARKPQESTSY
jgi:hypothetical protein